MLKKLRWDATTNSPIATHVVAYKMNPFWVSFFVDQQPWVVLIAKIELFLHSFPLPPTTSSVFYRFNCRNLSIFAKNATMEKMEVSECTRKDSEIHELFIFCLTNSRNNNERRRIKVWHLEVFFSDKSCWGFFGCKSDLF